MVHEHETELIRMNAQTRLRLMAYVSLLFLLAISLNVRAAEMIPQPPRISSDKTTNGQPRFVFPYPAAQSYEILSADNVQGPFTPDTNSGRFLGPTYIVTNASPLRIFKVGAVPMSSNDLVMATVLNRLTYGPTPDDIDRIRTIGTDAFIAEQMAPETIVETIDTDERITNAPLYTPPPDPLTNWIRVTATGTAGGGNLGFYMNGAGSVYIDNVSIVTGTNAEVGTNLLLNGDFEDPALIPPWIRGSTASSAVATNSPTVDGLAASGSNCVRVTFSTSTTSPSSGFYQAFLTNTPASTQRFTITFYYLPVQNASSRTLTCRVSGGGQLGGTVATAVLPSLPPAPPTPPTPPPAISHVYSRLTNTTARLDDLRAWHVFRAIHSKRQLHEVLAQFFQNHFTTQFQKTDEYFDNNFNDGQYTNAIVRENLALDLHWREHNRFRQALLNPNCNFHDLLKISIESEAMIIYLDTILSGKAAPNQNYAREIMELSTMGADNGYIQQDIVELAKVWTGWRVDKKDASVANNPFAPPISRANLTNFADTPGLWVLHYNTNQHHLGTKVLFTNNVIHPRFGPALGGGTSYSIIFSNTLAAGTNGMAEGYKVALHLANLPYTMEYLSVKLCRVFVHEDFHYGQYDYTAANLTPEAQLVKDCMNAWNTPASDGRKGNIRSVLAVIFNSDLFRSHGASQQKVKTPLEFAVSAVRALRMENTDSNNWVSSTCDSDGYGITGTNNNTSPLSRMGGMGLFNKPEPDGWSEFGRIWMNTANLCERMRFVQHLMMPTASTIKDDDYGSAGLRNTSDPVALLRAKLPGASWNNDGAVVDFFLGLLFPGEGAANLGRDREAAINYLNTDEAGTGSSAFAGLSGAAYDGRVRSMVGFLMCLPRFQEQ
jgi:uncharacterized protein (DUF1800 family)